MAAADVARPYEDRAAKTYMVSAIVWLVLAITLGLLQAIDFIAPDFAAGIPWLVFPRMRQAHVNGLAFGWLSMAMVGGWYYIVPRLTKTKIYSETLAVVVAYAWNLALAIGVGGLFVGWTQAREYAELAWPIDIGIVVLLVATGLQPVHDDRAAQGERPLRVAVVHHGHAHLVPDRLLDRQRHLGSSRRRAHRSQRCDLGLVLRSQHPRPVVHDRLHPAALLHRPQGSEAPAVRLHAGAHSILVPGLLLHRRGHAPHPPGSGTGVAQGHLGGDVCRIAHPGHGVRDQHVHDRARIVAQGVLLRYRCASR